MTRTLSDAERLEAVRRVLGAHLCEGLTSPSKHLRDFLRGLADELEAVGACVDAAIEQAARRLGYGPTRFSLDGAVYRLDHQQIDALGVVWEHTGDWAVIGGPVMCTPDASPRLRRQTLSDLVWTRGPLRSAKEPPPPEDGALAAAPTFDIATDIYRGYGVPVRAWDLSLPLEDNDGAVWRWTGGFTDGEPLIRRGYGTAPATVSAVELLHGPLHALEDGPE